MVLNLKNSVRDIRRLNHIILILSESGFGTIVQKLKLISLIPMSRRFRLKLAAGRDPPEVKLRKTFERLGPTFIKFGQLLSVRPDLVPYSYAKELERLQDDVPPFPYDDVKKIVESELKKPLKKVFSNFSVKPVASASISQIHQARLKNGRKVAVKVQRPGIRNTIDTDIEIMYAFASLLEKHVRHIAKFKPVSIVREFESWTKNELNFHLESRNAKIFSRNFKNSKHIVIPKIYDAFSTKSVLVLEYIDGVNINHFSLIREKKYPMKKLIHLGLDAILKQVFEDGFFHADPHPGNMIIVSRDKLAFVDFGIVGHFTKRLRKQTVILTYAIVEKDIDQIVSTLLDMCRAEPEIDTDRFSRDIEYALEPLSGSELIDVKLSSVLEQVFSITKDYSLQLPMSFVLFGKTIITLEGLAMRYDPHFRVIERVGPFVKSLMGKSLMPREVFKQASSDMIRMRHNLIDLPMQASQAIRKISDRGVKIDISDGDIKTLSLEIDRSSNRISYGMIIAAFLISGALTIQFHDPVAFGLPLISIVCFIGAIIFSLIFIISIVRERRLL